MRIGIDARLYGPTNKGIGRYTQQLIAELEKSALTDDYLIFLQSSNFSLYQPLNPHFQKTKTDIQCYGWREQILLPFLWRKYNLDVLHIPHFNVPVITSVFKIGFKKSLVVTIHDLIHLKANQQASTRHPIIYFFKHHLVRLMIGPAVKRANKIITVSEFAKNEIIRYYKINPNKIVVTYEAPIMTTEIRNSKSETRNPYLLYVGNAYPHKNLERLLRALKHTPNDLKLVLVGKIDYFYQRIQQLTKNLELEDRVTFTGAVTDEELANLYSNALAYVFPSLMEGFGLPGLEAMSCGCPVIASNAGPLPEIYGQAALYFDPTNIEEMTEAIKKITDDSELWEKLKKLGLDQVKQYSWEKCAKQTLEVYKNSL
jgi:glycosyltransferase involved in cell wall biosynthesis